MCGPHPVAHALTLSCQGLPHTPLAAPSHLSSHVLSLGELGVLGAQPVDALASSVYLLLCAAQQLTVAASAIVVHVEGSTAGIQRHDIFPHALWIWVCWLCAPHANEHVERAHRLIPQDLRILFQVTIRSELLDHLGPVSDAHRSSGCERPSEKHIRSALLPVGPQR